MGVEKLTNYFATIQQQNKNLFVPYIVAGDGGLDVLHERIDFLEQCGVAAIELGIPFSDPVADGPTIQRAGLRALKNGTTIQNVLDIVRESKQSRKVPIILMTYANPVYVYGIEKFAQNSEEAGVDGVIIPDVPLEEEAMFANALKRHKLAYIRLAALTSSKKRLKEIAKRTEGFLYAVSVTGTTGMRNSYEERVYEYLRTLKTYADVPVLAGFGISSPKQAHELSTHCDGVIVGSKIVDLFHEGKDEEVRALIEASIVRQVALEK